MKQCKILREYAQYVEKVREYASTMDLNAAVEKAVDECIHQGILEEFLRANRMEVIAVSIYEYDKEEEEKKLRRAEYAAGMLAGEKRLETLISLLLQNGRNAEIQKVVDDPELRENLYKEYNL